MRALLALPLSFAGCASSGVAGGEVPSDRTYTASLDAAVQAVQQAIARTRGSVTDYEQTPEQYVLYGRVENAVARSGGTGYPELTSFTVRVTRVAPQQARVVLAVTPAAGYGGRQDEAYMREFFAALEGQGLQQAPRASAALTLSRRGGP